MNEILNKAPKMTEQDSKNEENAANWDVLTEGQEGKTANWDILAEGEKKADWESVAEVEFQEEAVKVPEEVTPEVGEEQETEDTEEVAEKVALLRSWIDLEGIAKSEDPEGLAAAEQDGEVRRGRLEQRKAELAENEQKMAEYDKRQEELPKEVAKARMALKEETWKAERGIFRGIKRALGASKRAELEANYEKLREEQDGMWQKKQELESEQRSLESVIAEVDVDEAKREFLEKFETPLTPEEKEKGLDFDALAELSTEEYLQLWRRLNPFFVTHVTRQGIRDHSAMFYHSAGMGEFHDGMTGILADEKVLRTPAEVRFGLKREVTEQNTEEVLEGMLFNEVSQADVEAMREQEESDADVVDALVDNLPVNASNAAADPWADKRAVHFAQSLALDEYYGGESGNEAFFVFPTDVIASQCQFGGHIRNNLTTAEVESEIRWNDIFVWPKKKDITIDAGLTFLPKSSKVDAETGSKYATEEVEIDGEIKREPIVDEEAVTNFVEWMKGLKADDESVRQYDVEKLWKGAVEAGVPERMLDEIFNSNNGFEFELNKFTSGRELKDLWMVPAEELAKMSPEERRERSVREYWRGKPATWKLAENAVPAEEYWEKYFAEHPEQRPAHIIYYDGDPTGAVMATLKEAGILEEAMKPQGLEAYDEWQRYTGKGDSHERDGNWLGFEENLVRNEETDEGLQASHKKFNEIARRKIAEHYGLNL